MPRYEDLKKLKVAELKDLARKHGIKGFSNKRHDELVRFLASNLPEDEPEVIIEQEGAVGGEPISIDKPLSAELSKYFNENYELKKNCMKYLLSELKEIANLIGVSPVGKKKDLCDRIEDWTKNQSSEVEERVEQLCNDNATSDVIRLAIDNNLNPSDKTKEEICREIANETTQEFKTLELDSDNAMQMTVSRILEAVPRREIIRFHDYLRLDPIDPTELPFYPSFKLVTAIKNELSRRVRPGSRSRSRSASRGRSRSASRGRSRSGSRGRLSQKERQEQEDREERETQERIKQALEIENLERRAREREQKKVEDMLNLEKEEEKRVKRERKEQRRREKEAKEEREIEEKRMVERERRRRKRDEEKRKEEDLIQEQIRQKKEADLREREEARISREIEIRKQQTMVPIEVDTDAYITLRDVEKRIKTIDTQIDEGETMISYMIPARQDVEDKEIPEMIQSARNKISQLEEEKQDLVYQRINLEQELGLSEESEEDRLRRWDDVEEKELAKQEKERESRYIKPAERPVQERPLEENEKTIDEIEALLDEISGPNEEPMGDIAQIKQTILYSLGLVN